MRYKRGNFTGIMVILALSLLAGVVLLSALDKARQGIQAGVTFLDLEDMSEENLYSFIKANVENEWYDDVIVLAKEFQVRYYNSQYLHEVLYYRLYSYLALHNYQDAVDFMNMYVVEYPTTLSVFRGRPASVYNDLTRAFFTTFESRNTLNDYFVNGGSKPDPRHSISGELNWPETDNPVVRVNPLYLLWYMYGVEKIGAYCENEDFVVDFVNVSLLDFLSDRSMYPDSRYVYNAFKKRESCSKNIEKAFEKALVDNDGLLDAPNLDSQEVISRVLTYEPNFESRPFFDFFDTLLNVREQYDRSVLARFAVDDSSPSIPALQKINTDNESIIILSNYTEGLYVAWKSRSVLSSECRRSFDGFSYLYNATFFIRLKDVLSKDRWWHFSSRLYSCIMDIDVASKNLAGFYDYSFYLLNHSFTSSKILNFPMGDNLSVLIAPDLLQVAFYADFYESILNSPSDRDLTYTFNRFKSVNETICSTVSDLSFANSLFLPDISFLHSNLFPEVITDVGTRGNCMLPQGLMCFSPDNDINEMCRSLQGFVSHFEGE